MVNLTYFKTVYFHSLLPVSSNRIFSTSGELNKYEKKYYANNKQKKSYINNDKSSTPNFMKELEEAEEKVLDQTQQKLAKDISKVVFALTKKSIPKPDLPHLDKKSSLFPTDRFSSSNAKLFMNTFENPFKFLDERNSNLPESDLELKRLFIYQYTLQHESPGTAELPLNNDEENFLKHPKEWEQKFLDKQLNKRSLDFAILKWALKNNDKIKKLKSSDVASNEKSALEKVFDNSYNSMMYPKFSKSQMRRFYSNKLYVSNQFNQPLIFDMRFHKDVSQSSVSFLKQMDLVIAQNLIGSDPFHIVLCNFDKNTEFYEHWVKSKPDSLLQSMTITNKGLNDLEPTAELEDLVYLTPDSPSIMSEFSHNKAYIIGGLVDKKFQKQRTQTICRTERIISERLPLERYLMWGGYGGKKELTINTVFDILFSLKTNGSWLDALSKIPYRLHRGLSEMGKEVANYDPDIITRFDKGNQWKIQQDKRAPALFFSPSVSGGIKKTVAYLGKKQS